jgi:hypothetical protein
MATASSPISPGAKVPAGNRAGRRTLVVATIGFVVLILAGLIVVGPLWLFFRAPLPECPGCPGPAPIGSAMDLGSPVSGLCPANYTFSANGCFGGTHFYYRLHVLSSTVELGNFSLAVVARTGAPLQAVGALGFTVLNGTMGPEAQFATTSGELTMNTSWSYAPGFSASSHLTTALTVIIDMGTSSPVGVGLRLVITGEGIYSGTSAVGLP